MFKVMILDIPKIGKRNVDTLCIIISSYISCVWYNRENLNNIDYYFKSMFIIDQRLNMKLLGEKRLKVFPDKYWHLIIRF